ncbi:MAG: Eco57I restriction-modification methylase domain-containing protein [Anaerolineales bacterium]|nr:Eco57I restriction-modification methylase domain-containing protein [Anaerolineales bacterium]
MKLDFAGVQELLKTFDFPTLFREELGWELLRYALDIPISDETYHLKTIAHKRGFFALRYSGSIPAYAIRRKIDSQIAKSYHEHLIIYTDPTQTTQVWQWMKRQIGRPAASREHTFRREQSGEALIQKLEQLAVTLDEEDELTILDVAEGVRRGFDVERVTKRFYDRFKDEHAVFLKFIAGIPEEGMQRWYVSVTLNRLMFVYFIQKKGFLDGDLDYLRHGLAESQKQGRDRFYRGFLCPLFFKGFASKEHDATTLRLLGKVPFLNGGIFQKHQIEERHGEKLDIPDAAFERLFAFFEDYQWHLDERPTRNDREINPDVLGYIFEKYINQKQMGAYYTKEDITGYNSKYTIIPHLFDAARKYYKTGFEGDSAVWKLLQNEPDRYIYKPVRHGVTWNYKPGDRNEGNALDVALPLPTEIAEGLNDPSRRGGWNKTAPAEFALPTEIWREVVARRQRYEDTKRKLESGEVSEINDLITLNLDARQFAQDVIENTESVELLRAFWKAILSVTVLDPTVGSGAFLFAALNVLEALYEACLERMQAFVDELDAASASGVAHRPEKYADFKKVLAEIEHHPNRRYFILKSIIVDNLYGVDIMDEAVEICKLRLFLKLVAQVERVEQVEPLPDIDFNIRAGNTLVGFAAKEDVRRAVEMTSAGQMKLVSTEDNAILKRIEEKAQDVERLFGLFRQQQTELGGEVRPEDKAELQRRLKELGDELNIHLARQYGIHNYRSVEFDKWRESHKPFHWFLEFYGIMQNGGFNVIIGNPPYVEYNKVKNEYLILFYETEECGNLYAYVVERNKNLLSKNGRSGMIIPHSAFCTDRMKPIIEQFKHGISWISTYDIRPAKLFVGVDQRLAIYVQMQSSKNNVYSTKYHRWNEEARQHLFEQLQYIEVGDFAYSNSFAKAGKRIENILWQKIHEKKLLREDLFGRSKLYFHNAPRYWIRATTFAPYFWNERDGEKLSNQVKELNVADATTAKVLTSVLNSNLFYWWFVLLSDCRHLNRREVELFPVSLSQMSSEIKVDLAKLCESLMDEYQKSSVRKETEYQTTGRVVYDEYYPRYSKPIIDEIDRALARHYGLTAEELDFIINYDIKYRMGSELEEGEE